MPRSMVLGLWLRVLVLELSQALEIAIEVTILLGVLML